MGGSFQKQTSRLKLSTTYDVHFCHACGNALMQDACFCRKCGTRRGNGHGMEVDVDTNLSKLLVQADIALSTLTRPCMCCRPFSRRRAHKMLQQVLLELHTMPMTQLMRTDMDASNFEQSGMDKDTSNFLSNLLGFDGKPSKTYSNNSEASLPSPLPNTPSSTSQAPPNVLQSVGEKPRYSFQQVTDWVNFDIFEAALVVPRGSLFLELFLVADSSWEMVGNLKLRLESVAMALNQAQTAYEEPFVAGTKNVYHSSLHGAEVLCSAMSMLHKIPRSCIGMRLPALSKFAVVIAALMHDLHHPGVQARFLEAVQHEVFAAYLDDAPLERYHLAELFRLLNAHGVLRDMQENDCKRFRKLVAGMVLATDLAQGYKNTALVKAAFPAIFSDVGAGSSPAAGKPRLERSNSLSLLDSITANTNTSPELLNLVVECADVSHPAKPLEFHQRWSVLITHEFLHQGELETERGLPVSPLCSATSTMDPASFARSQQGFIDFVVRPKLTVLSKLCGMDAVWMRLLEENHAFWGSPTVNGFVEISESLKDKPCFEKGVEAARCAKPRAQGALRGPSKGKPLAPSPAASTASFSTPQPLR